MDKKIDIREESWEGEDIELFITLVPKVSYNVSLFISIATLGTCIEF